MGYNQNGDFIGYTTWLENQAFNTFLYGDLEEDVFMLQPHGFVKKGSEHLVYKLNHVLYGLSSFAHMVQQNQFIFKGVGNDF